MTLNPTTPDRLTAPLSDYSDLTADERQRVLDAMRAAGEREIREARRRRADMARWAQRWGAPPAAVSAETTLEAE